MRPGGPRDAQSGRIRLLPGAEALVDLTIFSEGEAFLAGSVLDCRGTPVRGVGVFLRSGAQWLSRCTDAQGRFRFDRLRTGCCALRIPYARLEGAVWVSRRGTCCRIHINRCARRCAMIEYFYDPPAMRQ